MKLTTSWLAEQTPGGRLKVRAYLLAQDADRTVVIAQADLDLPNWEAARALLGGLSEMVSRNAGGIVPAPFIPPGARN